MKRSIVIVCVLVLLGVLGGLALPVSNLVVGLPGNNSLISAKSQDPLATQAMQILGKKCVNCHTAEYVLPFYAKFPVAKQVIEADIKKGTLFLDLQQALGDGQKPAGEVVLAKSEYVLQKGSMPPMRYLALHWNGALTAAEKQTLTQWVQETRKKNYATAGVPEALAIQAIQPLPASVQEDAAKVALGKKLFHDKRLSKDNTIACASCHDLAKGGTDQQQFSEGVNKQFGDINAPTVLNAGFQFIQFWDGRAADLQAQADGPVNNPIEMASNWPEAIPKLQQDAELTAAFAAAYPEGYSKDTITNAIATFEKTLVTPNSKFDKFLLGDQKALSADEQAGYRIFCDKGCATCHVGKLLGGQSFERLGRTGDYFAFRGKPAAKPDFGRFNFSQKESDRFCLKVPTLRNIALTHPYMHDGTLKTLPEAVNAMAKFMAGVSLSQAEVDSVAKFLDTLTGEIPAN